jgi:alpha-ketoglutarate-dependent 2,4-dichlorophenoxyacetate dioxygenase
LTSDEVDALRDALGRFALLLFRGQRRPESEELVRFARSFGELHREFEPAGQGSESPYIRWIENDPEQDAAGAAGAAILPWHTDRTYRERPAKETLLEAIVVPGSGGDTSFCNMYRAWDALDPALRDELVDRRAWHRLDTYQAVREAEEVQATGAQEERRAELGTPTPESEAWQPVAPVHPEFGRTALYLNKFVYQIDGMNPSESQHLRDELLDAATTADNVYRHTWCAGDLLLADQVGTVHRRESFDSGQARRMRRVSTNVPTNLKSPA